MKNLYLEKLESRPLHPNVRVGTLRPDWTPSPYWLADPNHIAWYNDNWAARAWRLARPHHFNDVPKTSMRDEKQRPALASLCAMLPDGATMIEIGSFMGESGEFFLATGRIAKLYAVDPWQQGYDPNDVCSKNFDMADVEKQFDMRHGDDSRVVKLKMKSADAARQISDGSLDCVYIDGCHQYDAVRGDICAWLPKLKPDGWIAGHDFGMPGVRAAVDELVGPIDQRFHDDSWIKRLPVAPPPMTREHVPIVLFCLSCRKNQSRAESCRATWFGKLRQRGIPAFIVVGDPTATAARVDGDTLIVPSPDDRNLTAKVREMFRWALSRFDAKYFIKVDDDTYVHPDRLIALVESSTADYLGRCDSYPNWLNWVGSLGGTGGAGYLLSQRAARHIPMMQQQKNTDGWAEDIGVAVAMARAGIKLTDDNRLFWLNQRQWWPRPGNQMVTVHQVYAREDMQAIHAGTNHGAG